ncbi:14954_t:CDS:1, partial [Acaulospora morrowiae]
VQNSENSDSEDTIETFSDKTLSEDDSNVESIYTNSIQKIRKNSSWVWQYFRKRLPSQKWKKCAVLIKNKKLSNGQQECGQLIQTQGSTGNFQAHLNTHGITKPIQVNDTSMQLSTSQSL